MSNEYDVCHCNICEKDCKIAILYKYEVPIDESLEYDVAKDIYNFVKCTECNSIFIKHDSDEIWGTEVERKIYTIPPKHIVTDKFKNYYNYPAFRDDDIAYHIFKMYREVLAAINIKSFWLAFCGMRAIIEQVCQDKFGCKIADFKDMEKQISNTGLISDTIKPVIIRILDATHSSIHRKFFPDKEQIIKCLNGIDRFLEQIYILPQIGDTIENAKLPKKNGKINNK